MKINHVGHCGRPEWLAREATIWRKKGGGLYIVRLKRIAQDIMLAGGFIDQIGQDHFFEAKSDAIAAIYQKLNLEYLQTMSVSGIYQCEEYSDRRKSACPVTMFDLNLQRFRFVV